MGQIVDKIREWLEVDIAHLETVVGAYLTLEEHWPPRVHVWTLLDCRDPVAERQLAKAKVNLLTRFGEARFDFTNVHLQNRDPRQFIPAGALQVFTRNQHPMLVEYFTSVRYAKSRFSPPPS